jgi:putative Mn2+ efflux pump MntP
MWTSAALTAGLLVAPRFTRWLASVLVIFLGADVLQIAYKKAEDTLEDPGKGNSYAR